MRIPPAAVAIAFTGAAFAAQQISSSPSSEQSSFEVFRTTEACTEAAGMHQQLCLAMHDRASYIADHTVWPFMTFEDCQRSYGPDNCAVGAEGQLRVRMAGFTSFSKGTSATSALPVFRSSVYPGLYLPNAYPVVLGPNTVMSSLLDAGAFSASMVRTLDQKLCVSTKGEVNCRPAHRFVHGSTMSIPVVAALFNTGR